MYDDKLKAVHFANKLENIFKPYEDEIFNQEFKVEVENFVSSKEIFNYNSGENYEENFNLEELKSHIKTIKRKAARVRMKFQIALY